MCIINLILNLGIITYLLYQRFGNRIAVEVLRTWYRKIPYGIVLMKYKYPLDRGYEFNEGKVLFRYQWRKNTEIYDF